MPEVKIGRLRGGFCVYWTAGGQRRRYQLKARTREAAATEALDVYRRETYSPGTITVAQVWAEYVNDLGERKTAETMGYTGKAVLPFFGHYRPDQITRQMCRDYAARRAEQGKRQGAVHTELGHLRSALKFGSDVRLIDRAPHIWRPAKPEPVIETLTAKEAARLIDAATSPHIRLALILLLGTGARAGAILDLTWDRVDFINGTINLRLSDSVTRKGRAVVPMNRSTRAALKVASEAALSDYVVEYAGGPVKSISKGVSTAMKRAGIEGVTIHGLRHTAAATMAGAGVPMEKIAQILGHSNPSITYRTYARFAPDTMQDAVDNLDFARIRGLK